MQSLCLLHAALTVGSDVGMAFLSSALLTSWLVWQGFRITEKLRKVMESGAELMPEVRLSQILPAPVSLSGHGCMCKLMIEGLSRLLRQAAVTRRQM